MSYSIIKQCRPAYFLVILTTGLLASCTVGPNYQRPEVPKTNTYTREPLFSDQSLLAGVAPQQLLLGQEIERQWWTAFGSSELNALVDQALKNNPNIEAAQAALRQAQENSAAQFGAYFPTVQLAYSPSRQKNPVATISPTLSSGAPIYTLHTTQLSVSYAPDVFGLNRRTLESLQAQSDAQYFQLQATYLTLASNVVSAAIQEAALRAQIEATQAIIQAQTQLLKTLHQQAVLGAASGIDVATQETILAQTQQTLPPLNKQLQQTRDLIAVLAGKLPTDSLTSRSGLQSQLELQNLVLPHELPLSLPSTLVDHRPDIRIAEQQVHAASALVGVALANRLPQFSISAIDGGTSTRFGQMFDNGNTFWGLAGNAVGTIFDFGTLKHRQKAAEAALQQAIAQYHAVVLLAFQNVADSLYALDADTQALNSAIVSEQASSKLLDISQKQLAAGAINSATLLNAQVAYQQAKVARIQAQAMRLMDTAALFQSLGGSWQNQSI
jgi:NodT family efflux transporter outer membrane factor (OMF) lipoprotein